jgi:hypothetical protein
MRIESGVDRRQPREELEVSLWRFSVWLEDLVTVLIPYQNTTSED